MNDERPEDGFRERVIRKAADLPPQQRAMADYVLEHLTAVPFLSVPELARRVGVSEATVVRFAQRIGYPGFSELKMELVDILQNRLNGATDEAPEVVAEDVLASVATLEVTNIGRSVEALDRRDFDAVADAMFEAECVYTFGMGVSSLLAELAAYNLLQVGIRATPLSNRFTSPREQLVGLGEGDLLVAISLPPYSRQSLDLLADAKQLGIATLAICDRPTAPAANLSRWSLPIKSDNMMFTNAIAAVTVLLNALVTQIATSHREESLEALARINRALLEDEDVLPSTR
jgi:DNA-binding MurR/RpiR family transcriptional regulator